MDMKVHGCKSTPSRYLWRNRLKRFAIATVTSFVVIGSLLTTMRRDSLRCIMSFSVTVPMTSLAVTFHGNSIDFIERTFIDRQELFVSEHRTPPAFLITNERFCSGDRPMTYLFYVYSAPAHFDRRQAIRETWGQSDLFVNIYGRVIFIVGVSMNHSIQERMLAEQRLHGDLVMVSFVDSYKNLTTKGIAALQWLNKYCRNVEFLMKTDDDVMVDIYGLLTHLVHHVRNAKRSFFCRVNHDGTVVREGCWKWEVTEDQFPATIYPPYCDGPLWIVTRDIIPELANMSLVARYLPIEDAFTSGILAKGIGNVRHVWLHGLEILFTNTKLVRYQDRTRPVPLVSIPMPGIHYLTWKEIYCRWYSQPRNLNISNYFALDMNAKFPARCASISRIKGAYSLNVIIALLFTMMIRSP